MYRPILLSFALAIATAAPARAVVIFEEQFDLREIEYQMVGTQPNIVNTNNAIFLRSPELGGESFTHVDQYAPGVAGLLLNPRGPNAGSFNQNMWLPYDYAFGEDPVRLTLVARQSQPRWNNFSFGFTGPGGGLSSWILLQTNPAVTQTNIQIFHDQVYNTPVTPGIYAGDFRTIVMEYDPTKAATPGQNPFSLSVDNVPFPLAGSNVPAINAISGIGFGFFFGDGQFDRTVLLRSLKFEVLSDSPAVPGDFNGDGNVDGADFVIWQTNFPNTSGTATLAMGDANGDGNIDGADFVIWQTNFPTTGSGGVTAVPEPATWSLGLLGLLAFAWRRFA